MGLLGWVVRFPSEMAVHLMRAMTCISRHARTSEIGSWNCEVGGLNRETLQNTTAFRTVATGLVPRCSNSKCFL